MNIEPLLAALRSHLGAEVMHQGVRCRLQEVLGDGPALILADCEANTSIQENQYGGMWRRVPRVYTVPVLSADGTGLHAQFLALNLPLAGH